MAVWTRAALRRLEHGVAIRDDEIAGRHGGIPIRRYTPSASRTAPLMWLHGGGFSAGGLDQLESHAVSAALASRGVPVVAVAYRLVPPWWGARKRPPVDAVRFPVPLDDVVDAFGALRAEHGRLALGGASAGACLAAGAALRLRDESLATPAALLLAYGTFHAELPEFSESVARRVRGRHAVMQFRPRTVAQMNANYVGDPRLLTDAYAFPGGGRLEGLPPTFLLDADRDTLRASGEAFAQELRAAGVDTRHHVVRGSTHGFLDRPQRAPFAEGIDRMATWLLDSGAA